jgi:hypothetical protein
MATPFLLGASYNQQLQGPFQDPGTAADYSGGAQVYQEQNVTPNGSPVPVWQANPIGPTGGFLTGNVGGNVGLMDAGQQARFQIDLQQMSPQQGAYFGLNTDGPGLGPNGQPPLQQALQTSPQQLLLNPQALSNGGPIAPPTPSLLSFPSLSPQIQNINASNGPHFSGSSTVSSPIAFNRPGGGSNSPPWVGGSMPGVNSTGGGNPAQNIAMQGGNNPATSPGGVTVPAGNPSSSPMRAPLTGSAMMAPQAQPSGMMNMALQNANALQNPTALAYGQPRPQSSPGTSGPATGGLQPETPSMDNNGQMSGAPQAAPQRQMGVQAQIQPQRKPGQSNADQSLLNQARNLLSTVNSDLQNGIPTPDQFVDALNKEIAAVPEIANQTFAGDIQAYDTAIQHAAVNAETARQQFDNALDALNNQRDLRKQYDEAAAQGQADYQHYRPHGIGKFIQGAMALEQMAASSDIPQYQPPKRRYQAGEWNLMNQEREEARQDIKAELPYLRERADNATNRYEQLLKNRDAVLEHKANLIDRLGRDSLEKFKALGTTYDQYDKALQQRINSNINNAKALIDIFKAQVNEDKANRPGGSKALTPEQIQHQKDLHEKHLQETEDRPLNQTVKQSRIEANRAYATGRNVDTRLELEQYKKQHPGG